MFDSKLIEQIQSDEFSCIVNKNDKLHTANKRGVAPILDLIDAGENTLNDAVIYDKVIGKAASMLLAENKIRAVYGLVMSELACEYLEKHNIPYAYQTKVEYILNRTNDGMCPLEQEVLNLFDSSKAYDVLRARIKILMQNK